MKRAFYLLLLISGICTAQTKFTFYPTQHIFTLEGKRYATSIDEAALEASPTWDMSKPPPISFKQVVEVARNEFGKRLRAKPEWRVRSIELYPANSPHEGKWYYVVLLEPQPNGGHTGESFTTLVDFSGKPGKIILDSGDSWTQRESKANGKSP